MSNPTLKINYVEFPAADLAAIEEFYSGAFGWKFTSYGDEYVAFSDGTMDGGFFKTSAQPCTQTGNPHSVGTLVVLYASDLESARDAVVAASGKLTKDIFSFPGGRRFQFLDPAGNELSCWSDK